MPRENSWDDATVTDYALELRGISKSYGNIRAVKEVSLEVPRGQFLCIIGPSGCGKTTLLRIIAGFIEPSSGDILVDGRSVVATPPYRRPVNMVFQHYALFPHMTVEQNVRFGLEMHKVPRDEWAGRVREVLSLVELEGYETRSVQELSGGQEQRVALARALVLKPATLLLDEPLGALDQKVRRRMQLELKRIHQDLGITFIHVTHDQEEALVMADRIAVMNEGLVEQIGSKVEVYTRPRTAFAAEFVGESNSFEGKAVQGADGSCALEIAPGHLASLPDSDSIEPGAQVRLFVRPEHMSLDPPEGNANWFEGTVRDIVFLGDAVRCIVVLAREVELMVSLPGGLLDTSQRPKPGDRVRVGWRRQAGMVFRVG